jgi:predicted solute-binding protein
MRFAYRKEFATEPLARALENRGWIVTATENPADALLAGNADIVLTPALDYARNVGVVDFALVPGVGIMTAGFAGVLKLVFNRGLSGVASIAAHDPGSSDAMVARIVLSEKHDIEPRMVPAQGKALDDMLATADAALLAGDDAVFDLSGNTSLLDLSDEWEDLVEAPLPYMIAWGRVGEIDDDVLAELTLARDAAVLMLPDFAATHEHGSVATAFYERYLKGSIRYSLEEQDLIGLDALYRYAFYYALVSDVPAIKYLPEGEPANIPQPPEA